MKSTFQNEIFQYKSLKYCIKNNRTEIIIQIINKQQNETEQSFKIKQFKKIQFYFSLFSSLQNIYEDLISFAKNNKRIIEEKNEIYLFILSINLKEINTLTFERPKTFKPFISQV